MNVGSRTRTLSETRTIAAIASKENQHAVSERSIDPLDLSVWPMHKASVPSNSIRTNKTVVFRFILFLIYYTTHK